MARITVNTDTNTLVGITPTTPKERLRTEAEVYGYAAAMVEGGLLGSVEARLHADATINDVEEDR